ncbi:5517_t:CDS:2 [Funneliformis mosseae]|uniref:5517_t:CDS:1 n=1 Tax=Funneliformis mosseae TaxID=27381 RepID=A0A9N8YL30_FUNMO|nr:5517_t:CDS:2 [Funneliformis mosseae]
MAIQTNSTKNPTERILYDIDVVAVWKPEDELGDQEANSQVKLHTNPNDPSYSQIPRSMFKQVTHRLVRSLEKLAISTTVPRALIQARPKVTSEIIMQLSPNGLYLAVSSDHKIEIRTSKSGFETNHSIFISRRDTFPKWRRLSWSPDSKILAVARSDGTIEIIDENGGLVCVILSSTNINSDGEKDAQGGSSFFLEPVAFLYFVDPKRGLNSTSLFDGYSYQYELLVVTFDGILRSYLINTVESAFTDIKEASRHTRSNMTYSREGPSDPGYFAFYHKFSFKQWLSTITCGAVVTWNGLVLCLGGKSSFENKDDSTSPSVTCWMLLPERPFYRKLELEGSDDGSIDDVLHLDQGTVDDSGFFYRLINIFSTWRNTNKLFTDEIILNTVLSPNQQNLLTLDFSGTVKLWNLSLNKGLELNKSWDQPELNYFARGKEFKDLSLEVFIDKILEIESEGGIIAGIPGFDNGKVVSIGWWSDNAIILGYQYGSMIIACLPEMINILGESPESFKSCREITSQCSDRFLVIEHEVKAVKARMINDGFVRYSREQEEGDMEDDESDESESQLSRLISVLANYLHHVTDTLLWHFENDPSESRGKIITVSRKTYCLNRISKILPQELLNRKINALDYDDALVIAETYDLDTDIIYQARWKDAEVSEAAIHDYLDKIRDREWVLSACIHTFSNTPDLLRLLLNYGLKDTDILVEILNNGTSYNKDEIIKSLRERPFEVNSKMEDFLGNLQISEKDVIICQYRHYFLKYLDRLRTYENIIEEKTKHDIENRTMKDFAEENDGWITFVDYTSTFAEDYAVFRDLNIAALAMDYATEEFFKGLNILFTRHGPETLPYRFTILEQIPETADPDEYESFLPSVTSNGNNGDLVECSWNEQPWRDIDWVDNPILKKRILPELDLSKESDVGGIRLKPVEYPARSTLITNWYIDRAHRIDSVSGQVDKALILVRHGIKKKVVNLETLEENLDMLAKLVYDCYPDLESVSKSMSLKEFEALTEAEIVQVFLQHTNEKRIVNDIKNFIIPFLRLLPARRARLNHILKDDSNDKVSISNPESEPMSLLYNYILNISLSNLELSCTIFEASKPVFNIEERIITSDEDLARVALACLYGNSSTDNWEVMTRIYECLPIFDVEGNRTSLEVNSLQSYTPYELFPLFKSKNECQLQSFIDSLEIHLNAAEVLAQYGNAVPLCWFLQSSENYALQKQLCIQLARKAGGGPESGGEKFESEDEWILLLEKILKLQGNGKGVFGKISTEEIYKIFISSLLSCGKFNLAREIILPTDQPQPLDMDIVEKLVIDASREFFDNAPSGNMYHGYMKMAYECLQILPMSDSIRAEVEFIEATHKLTEQKVYHQPGIPIHPMQIRLASNKLDLIARLLSTNEEVYYDYKTIIELAKKLGYRNDKVAEVKVMAMLADTAIRDSNLSFAYDMCIDIMKIIKSISNVKTDEKKEVILKSSKDVAWRICYEVAKQETFQNLEKKMTLMGYALALCPSDQAVDILNVWRKIDEEYRAELIQKAGEKSMEKPKSAKIKPVVERVESSLLTPLLQGDRIKKIFIKTPDSPLYIGKVASVSWSSDTPLEGTGELRLMFNASVNILVDANMDLKPLFYNWIITSPPGTFYWGLFSTQPAAFSREFNIVNAPDGSSPTKAITSLPAATTILATQTQTVVKNDGSSLSKGVIIGVFSVVGIIGLAGLSVYAFLRFRKPKYIPTPGS